MLIPIVPPLIHFEWNFAWGSAQAGHREAIRQRLAQVVPDAKDSILRLDAPPNVSPLYASISHCRKLGGLVVSSVPVGLDFEEAHRINPELVARISSLEEFSSFPESEMIWPAKEAAFKCLSHVGLQPAGISKVQIRYKSSSPSAAQFEVFAPITLAGRIFRIDDVLVALVLESISSTK